MNIIKQIARYTKKFTGGFHWDNQGDIVNTVFLCGSPRSGSTWVEEILNFDQQYRLMFEPFHPKKVAEIKDWGYRQYFSGRHNNAVDTNAVTKILSGRIRNLWVDQFNSKRIVKQRLVKEVRAGLMLDWLHNLFPKMPIIFMIRHPFAVTQSRVNLNWNMNLNMYLDQEQLVKDYLEPFVDLIKSAQNLWEKQLLSWCIENYVPMQQLDKNSGIHVVFYETLYSDPDTEVPRLLKYIGKKANEKVFLQHQKPSAMVRPGSSIETGKTPMTNWRNQVSPDQLERANFILKQFGLDNLYSEKGIPDIAPEQVFNR